MSARFVSFDVASRRLRGQYVAIVGSAPSVLDNQPGFVDSHEIVVRVNNYKLGEGAGKVTDVHYSFYGNSIRKSAQDLQRDGVKLCMCKCPDAKPIESDWHERNDKTNGIDFRYIYKNRSDWWFCDTHVPDVERFLKSFELLGRHIPSTGFSAILDVLDCAPRGVYLTGFDFFASAVHNVDEPWRPGDPEDPIGHRPDRELTWLAEYAGRVPLTFDDTLARLVRAKAAGAAGVAKVTSS